MEKGRKLKNLANILAEKLNQTVEKYSCFLEVKQITLF